MSSDGLEGRLKLSPEQTDHLSFVSYTLLLSLGSYLPVFHSSFYLGAQGTYFASDQVLMSLLGLWDVGLRREAAVEAESALVRISLV
jgi:hypothetical protein